LSNIKICKIEIREDKEVKKCDVLTKKLKFSSV